MKRSGRGGFLTGFIAALIVAMLALAGYIVWWYGNRARIEADGRRYQALYVTEVPTPTGISTKTPVPTETPKPTDTLAPTETPKPTATPAPRTLEPQPTANDVPIPTPDADTLVMALPTAPPVQESFARLLAVNPETVGFLTIGDELALPVVQRVNDNDWYLTHTFEGKSSSEGALFLDGSNLLVPEDDCLIVYGHNMKNGAMFGMLHQFTDLSFLKRNAVVRFNTIYEDRAYVAFAAFTASMEPDDARYFEVRRFLPNDEAFIDELRARSRIDVPVECAPEDRLLLLVTCDYTRRDGRYIVALRALRAGESEADVAARVARAS